MPAADLSGAAAQQRKAEEAREAAQETQDPLAVRTAFLVLITKEGESVVVPDINFPVVPERGPNQDEIVSSCQRVGDYITNQVLIQAVTQSVVANMARLLQAQQEQRAMASNGELQAALADVAKKSGLG